MEFCLKAQLYILGFLKRFGPQHGYALKQLLSKHAADFANIKMSNIYYHFEKMAKQGLLRVSFEKEGKRPDRQVYSITPAGEKAFSRLLLEALKVPFDFESIIDGPLFFSEYSSRDLIIVSLEARISQLEVVLDHIDTHRKEIFTHIPKSFKKYTTALFDHHKAHYLAEMEWARKAIVTFKK